MEPECIILDEPTAMLDPMGRREVLSTIKNLNKNRGMTVILITHYMDEAAEADRCVILQKGKIMIDDTPRSVFREVKLIKKIGLDVPQVTELAHELRKQGIPIRDDIITIDECARELLKYL